MLLAHIPWSIANLTVLKQQYCFLQSFSAPGKWKRQTPRKPDQAVEKGTEKGTAPSTPVVQEIKGLLGLAYPDLVTLATTACDDWKRGQTQVWVVPYAALNTDAHAPQVSPTTASSASIAMQRCFAP